MYAEWDTWDTIDAVKNAIAQKHDVTLVEANHDAFDTLKKLRPDIVFNIAEGFAGISREAQIPAMLDMLMIPYTGSDPLTLATTLDKARTKEVLSYYNIPTPKFLEVTSIDELKSHQLQFPLVVKPIGEGSGKGIYSSSLVSDNDALLKEAARVLNEYKQSALVEEFLPGREFTVAILGNNGSATVLPIIEITYDAFPKDFVPLYSYEAKWILDSKENQLDIYKCPAKIDASLEASIKKICLDTYKILRCKDWSRIDLRLDKNGVPNIIEVNPLPRILPHPKDNSCYPKAARTAGIDYNNMLLHVLDAARERYNI
jgi:D-alanine-D-alanine ligase